MQRHALNVISALKRDRSRGLSISELVKKYSLPKTTVWHHIKSITLDEVLRTSIRSKQGGTKLKSLREWDESKIKARLLLKDFKERNIWPILVAALYWSEGTKKSGFVFTNTDESMIRVFLKILRVHLKVRDSDIDILIRTCVPMKPTVCRKYWSKVTSVPYQYIRINHDDKQNKSKSTYGICRVTLKKGGSQLKLMHCLIREMTAKIL